MSFVGWLCQLLAVVLIGWFTLWATGWHIKHRPTADELYGCSVAQEDPATGECK